MQFRRSVVVPRSLLSSCSRGPRQLTVIGTVGDQVNSLMFERLDEGAEVVLDGEPWPAPGVILSRCYPVGTRPGEQPAHAWHGGIRYPKGRSQVKTDPSARFEDGFKEFVAAIRPSKPLSVSPQKDLIVQKTIIESSGMQA